MKNIDSFNFINQSSQSFKSNLLSTTSIGNTIYNFRKNTDDIINPFGIYDLPVLKKIIKNDKEIFYKGKNQNNQSFKSELLSTTSISNAIDSFRKSTQNIIDDNELALEMIKLYKFAISENYEDIELYKILFFAFAGLKLNIEELYHINARICKIALSIDPTNEFFMGFLNLFGDLNDEEKESINNRLGIINKKS